MLDLCLQVFDKVEAVFMYVVPDLSFEERELRQAEKRTGVMVHRVPHWMLSYYLGGGHWRFRALDVRQVGQKQIENLVRHRTGYTWTAWGHRMDDSLGRRFYLRHRGVIDWRCMRLAPLYDWRAHEVEDYVRAKGIPLPHSLTYGRGPRRRSRGFTLHKECIRWCRDNYPEDYQRVLEWFPALEVQEGGDDGKA